MKKGYWSAVASLVGTTIGAGILGIPYVISKSGFFTGALDIILLFILVTVVSLYLAEVVLRTKDNHQITGLAEIYLGRSGKFILLFSMVVIVFGAMVAYTYGASEALTKIFGGNEFFNSILFFSVLSFVFYFGIKIFEKFESMITVIFILIIFLICLIGISSFSPNNLTEFNITKIFVPFGVILFATTGFLVIPEMKKELSNKRDYKKSIIFGVGISSFIYLIFTALVLGVSGDSVTTVATIGLGNSLGMFVNYLGNLLAILVMGTSFVSMGFALKNSFKLDYKISPLKSWILVILFPLILIFSRLGDFIRVMEYSAIIGSGLLITCILIMHSKSVKYGKRDPEFHIYGPVWLKALILILLIAGGVVIL